MKAIQITETGGPEVMKYMDLPDLTPGVGQAVVEPKALGVNFTDIYTRSGVNPPASLPTVIGLEGAGVVTALGDGATGVAVGDRVAWSSIGQSYTEQVAAPADKLVKLPEGLSFDDGAAIMLQGMTAHYLCHSSYPIKQGDTALVHAAAGGVGLILTQMIKALGGTVIGTVSTDEKAELAKNAGADYVIKYTEQDFEEEVGKIKLHMHGRFPLGDVAEAHRQLAGRLTTGKLLLIP